MPKLIELNDVDLALEIDKYKVLARKIQDQCGRTSDGPWPSPVMVVLLMVGDNLAQGNDGVWAQLENIWQLVINYNNSH